MKHQHLLSLLGQGHHGRGFLLLAVVLIAIEYGWHRLRGTDGYDLKESASSLLVAGGRIVTRGVSGLVQAPVFLWAHDHRLFTIAAGGAFTIGMLFLLSEFLYYWFHRASHVVRWMWASHCVHHSPTRLNLSAAYRLGWTDLISGNWLFFLPAVLIGFDPVMVLGMMGANLSYQFFLHTEAVRSLGPLEWVLNTPAHHRVHHASNAQCLDKNYGGVLIVYDRLFGTFAKAPADEPLRYGLLSKAPSYNPVTILFREWLDIARDLLHARSPSAAWRAVSGRP
jgi:sterol desaturase/sphingolipid hydroxylase (fatty acid hydroxylase superfamily)